MIYRLANPNDARALSVLRKRQLMDEGMPATQRIDDALLHWFTEGIENGSITVWVAEDDGMVIATGSITYMSFPPSFSDPVGHRGYINSLYTSPEYRGRGIATALMDRLVADAKAHGARRLWVGASRMGRRVYQKYGFRDSDEWLELSLDE